MLLENGATVRIERYVTFNESGALGGGLHTQLRRKRHCVSEELIGKKNNLFYRFWLYDFEYVSPQNAGGPTIEPNHR